MNFNEEDQKIFKIPSLSETKMLWESGGFQKYFRNTSWMFAAKFLSIFVSFLATAVVARQLGPSNFGQLSYAISFVGLFSFLYSLGIDSILYRDLIKFPEKRMAYMGSAFFIKLATGVLTILVIGLSAFFIADKDVSLILIFILSGSFIFNSFQIINYEFQAKVESKYPSIASFCVVVILNLLKIFVVLFGGGVIYLALILLLESVLYAGFFLFIYKVKLKEKITNWTIDKKIIFSLIKDSWPLIFTGVFSMIYARIDQLFIKHMLGPESVGIYDSAVRVSEVWYFIPNILVGSFFPAIVNAKRTSEKVYNSRIFKLGGFLIIMSLAISILVTILSNPIINILYGPSFAGAEIVLRIYVWSIIGTSLITLFSQHLLVEGKTKIIFILTIAPMIVNVILNILWIPKYGVTGAAFATLISYSISPIFFAIIMFGRKNN